MILDRKRSATLALAPTNTRMSLLIAATLMHSQRMLCASLRTARFVVCKTLSASGKIRVRIPPSDVTSIPGSRGQWSAAASKTCLKMKWVSWILAMSSWRRSFLQVQTHQCWRTGHHSPKSATLQCQITKFRKVKIPHPSGEPLFPSSIRVLVQDPLLLRLARKTSRSMKLLWSRILQQFFHLRIGKFYLSLAKRWFFQISVVTDRQILLPS